MSLKNNSNKAIILAAALSVPILAFARIVPWEANTTRNAINTQVNNSTQQINNQIGNMSDGYTKTINENTSKIIEAIRLATSQEAIGTTQMADADKKSKQVMATAMMADQLAEDQLHAVLNYGTATGQGYAACKVLAENQQLSDVMDAATKEAAGKVMQTDNAPGRLVSSIKETDAARQEMHNNTFCTESEEKNGTCKMKNGGVMAGADSDASTLFVSAKKGSSVAFAKQAVRQNILGSPIEQLPPDVARSAIGKGYLLNTNHKTALSAFPAYSLAYLESMSEIRDDIKDADGNPMSPNDMLFNTVARYYGGKDSLDWQKSMIQQTPRGLMVELLKQEGLTSWMSYEEFAANQRIEGNIAAMTLTAALPIEEQLQKQKALLDNIAIKDNIRRKGQ